MQTASIKASPRKSPIKITDKHSANKTIVNINYNHFSGDSIRLNSRTHSKVNKDGFYELEEQPGKDYFIEKPDVNIYKFRGKNLIWNTPVQQLNIEIETTDSNSVLGGGVNFSMFNSIILSGANFRIAYFKNFEWFSGRIDYSLHWNKIHYNVDYLTTSDILIPDEDKETHVRFYNETNTEIEWNYEISISLNTSQEEFPVNMFFNLNFGNQTFYDLQDKVKMFGELEYTDKFSNFSYGLYTNINDQQRLIIGINRNYHSEGDRGVIKTGFIFQYDYLFNF